MQNVGMFVVPVIMPLSELRCATLLCVLTMQGVQKLGIASTRFLWCAFPRLINSPVRHHIGHGMA